MKILKNVGIMTEDDGLIIAGTVLILDDDIKQMVPFNNFINDASEVFVTGATISVSEPELHVYTVDLELKLVNKK